MVVANRGWLRLAGGLSRGRQRSEEVVWRLAEVGRGVIWRARCSPALSNP
jgi:hypothetical protein